MTDKRKTEKILWVVTISFLIVFFIISVIQLFFLFGLKKKQNDLESQIETSRSYIEEKQQEIDYLSSDEFLEQWALEHGYTLEG